MKFTVEVNNPEATPTWLLQLLGTGGPEEMVVVRASSAFESSLAECDAVIAVEHKGMKMSLAYTESDQASRIAVTREMNKRLGSGTSPA